MSEMQDQKVEDVAKSGPGLLFLVYPSGIMSLDYAGFWSVLFFFMVILIGIDSQFCTMEGFYTAIIDEWPQYLRKSPNREIFIAIFSGISFLIGLSMVTEGGIWVFQILDDYGASSWCLLWLLFFECIAISWLYGVDKWYVHLKDMIGYQPSMWWKFCWVYACPFCCIGIFIFSLIDYQGTTYNGVSVPAWADGMGWLIALSSMLCIPIYAAWLWRRTPGSFNQNCNASHILEILRICVIAHARKYKAIVCPDIDVAEIRERALKNEEGKRIHGDSICPRVPLKTFLEDAFAQNVLAFTRSLTSTWRV
uniref:Uncharacterized protein n=1 Tax=Romanomermis culicivorax TaxID=13658 RepID=A0A915IWW9_ROMCU